MQNKNKRISDDEWLSPRDRAWKAILDGDYGKAVRIVAPFYKRYPADPRVIYYYASTLADYGESLQPKERKRLKELGCKLLRGLLRRMRGMSRALGYSARNEYYYHSAQYDKQYHLGVERVLAGEKSGYYSQGVGAAWHAYAHAIKDRRRFAGIWAGRAISAWEKYFGFRPDYYNAYVHYALALGIMGRFSDMEAALAKSAKLSGKPRSYHEFTEVRRNISAIGKVGKTGK